MSPTHELRMMRCGAMGGGTIIRWAVICIPAWCRMASTSRRLGTLCSMLIKVPLASAAVSGSGSCWILAMLPRDTSASCMREAILCWWPNNDERHCKREHAVSPLPASTKLKKWMHIMQRPAKSMCHLTCSGSTGGIFRMVQLLYIANACTQIPKNWHDLSLETLKLTVHV